MMWQRKQQPAPPDPPELSIWAIDWRASLVALVLAGTITPDEAEKVQSDRIFLQGNAYSTPATVAQEIGWAIERARAGSPRDTPPNGGSEPE